MDKNSAITKNISESIELKKSLLSDENLLNEIGAISEILIRAFKSDKKLLFCGNGGSAADAQHLAAELSGRYYYDRPPLFAEALHVNTSYTTAVANDYSYDEIYARLVRAMGRENDVLIGLSTSGNSKNVVNALKTANEIGMVTIGMTGSSGGVMNNICRHIIRIPSDNTPRIQECHMIIGHTLCEIVESEMFPK